MLAAAARSCLHRVDELASSQWGLTPADAAKLARAVARGAGATHLPPRARPQPALTFLDLLEFLARAGARLDLVAGMEGQTRRQSEQAGLHRRRSSGSVEIGAEAKAKVSAAGALAMRMQVGLNTDICPCPKIWQNKGQIGKTDP